MPEVSGSIPNEKRGICAAAALNCSGTAYIFEKRAKKIRRKVIALSVLGIASPGVVGLIIGTYQLNARGIQWLLYLAGGIGIVQFVLSVWSLASGWDRNLAYYLETKAANYRLADQYDRLAKTSVSAHDFEVQFQALEREAEIRSTLDNQYDVSDQEKQMGMRFGLRKYQRPCAGCGKIPTSMKASDCGICGGF